MTSTAEDLSHMLSLSVAENATIRAELTATKTEAGRLLCDLNDAQVALAAAREEIGRLREALRNSGGQFGSLTLAFEADGKDGHARTCARFADMCFAAVRGVVRTEEKPDVDAPTGCADDQSELGRAVADAGSVVVRHALTIMKLRSALQFYADSWATKPKQPHWRVPTLTLCIDAGEKARAALASKGEDDVG